VTIEGAKILRREGFLRSNSLFVKILGFALANLHRAPGRFATANNLPYRSFNSLLFNKQKRTMSISIGDKAPIFTLYSDTKQPVSLQDYQGQNVVLLFFPLAFTGVCTQEMCSMRDSLADYNGMNTSVLAISVDSLFTLEQFKKAENLNFPLLSDFNREVSRQYGALYEEFVLNMRGVSKRSAFVIDGTGVVRYAEVLESAGDLPNFAKIKETLQGLN
jgi:peroxiredoxin